MFISTGAVGVGIVMLKAYKARLAARLEWARLERTGDEDDYAREQVRDLENQVRRLEERVEFNEKLLGGGTSPSDDNT